MGVDPITKDVLLPPSTGEGGGGIEGSGKKAEELPTRGCCTSSPVACSNKRASSTDDSDNKEEEDDGIGPPAAGGGRGGGREEEGKEELQGNYEDWSAKQLRTEVSKRKIRGMTNKKKAVLVGALKEYDERDRRIIREGLVSTPRGRIRGKSAVNNSNSNKKAPSTRKTKHCSFRLVNVLFNDDFAERFSKTDGSVTRAVLDEGAVNGKSRFWLDVQAAFVSENNEEYGRSLESNVSASTLFKEADIDPSIVTPHDSSKLLDIWKELNAAYMESFHNFKVSGTHDSDFWNFCKGRMDVLYLYNWLQVKPGLTEFVRGRLPDAAALDFDENGDVIKFTGDATSEPSVSTKKKKKAKTTQGPLNDITFKLDNTVTQTMNSASRNLYYEERTKYTKTANEINEARKARLMFEDLQNLTKQLVLARQMLQTAKDRGDDNDGFTEVLQDNVSIIMQKLNSIKEKIRASD